MPDEPLRAARGHRLQPSRRRKGPALPRFRPLDPPACAADTLVQARAAAACALAVLSLGAPLQAPRSGAHPRSERSGGVRRPVAREGLVPEAPAPARVGRSPTRRAARASAAAWALP